MTIFIQIYFQIWSDYKNNVYNFVFQLFSNFDQKHAVQSDKYYTLIYNDKSL